MCNPRTSPCSVIIHETALYISVPHRCVATATLGAVEMKRNRLSQDKTRGRKGANQGSWGTTRGIRTISGETWRKPQKWGEIAGDRGKTREGRAQPEELGQNQGNQGSKKGKEAKPTANRRNVEKQGQNQQKEVETRGAGAKPGQ